MRLDTHAIRHKSLKDYRKAEQSLEQLKSELKRFREQDTPGFKAWLHQTFGTLLTRQREVAQAIVDKQNLLLEIEDIADRYRLSDVAAYRKVMGATNPKEAADGTIRKLFALSIGENSVHGSDSADNAKIEIAQFFTDAEIPG